MMVPHLADSVYHQRLPFLLWQRAHLKTTDPLFLWVNQFNSTNNYSHAFPTKLTENDLFQIHTDTGGTHAKITSLWKVNMIFIAMV